MKLSASKWLAFFGAFTSKNGAGLDKRQSTDVTASSSLKMFPAPPGTFTLPPGPQTLIISGDRLVGIEQETDTTYLTTLTDVALTLITEGPNIYYPITKLPWATLYVEGDPTMIVSETASATMTASVVTSLSCSESVCSPTPTPVVYTCGMVNGVAQPVTTVLQSYSCTTGQTCEGEPVKTYLTCNCGGPICTTTVSLAPLVPVIVPVGAPIPPTVPAPPDVPEPGPEPEPDTPETTFTDGPTTSSESPPTSSEDPDSSDTSTMSSTSTSSSSSNSNSSSSLSTSINSTSTSSSASACSIGAFSIPSDFDSTLSAWLSQYPIVITSSPSPSTTSNSSSLTSSTTSVPSTSVSVTSSTSTTTPTPSPSPTTTLTPLPTSTTMSTSSSNGCDAACSSSSASSAFEAGLSSSMAAGHSSATEAFSSALSVQSVSISSAQAISKCQHYTLGYPWNPPDIPVTLATYNGPSQYGRWMCVVDPTKIDTSQDWNSTWKYQPFSVNEGWDKDHPQDTLVDTFCNYLVNQHADVTSNGNVQGVCQAYDMGQCLNPTRSGQCTLWEHPWTTLDTWGPVMISVSYMGGCPLSGSPHPVNFGSAGAQGCKGALNALVDHCSFPGKRQKGWAQKNPMVGGTIWSDCMIYTIVGIMAKDKPDPIWQPS